MLYLSNAISLGMLDELNIGATRDIRVSHMSLDRAIDEARDAESIVGHADTAELLSALLRRPVEMRRVSTSLKPGDVVIVAQYNGPRLPEGARSLPEGAKIRWFRAEIHFDLWQDGCEFSEDPTVAK